MEMLTQMIDNNYGSCLDWTNRIIYCKRMVYHMKKCIWILDK